MCMQWEVFRCQTNCTAYPTACINQDLYMAQTVGSLFLCATWPSSSQSAFPTQQRNTLDLPQPPPPLPPQPRCGLPVPTGRAGQRRVPRCGLLIIHIDDCWMETSPPRNAQGQLQVRHEAPASPGFSNQLSKQRVESAVDPL
jgi:hypothetical protein